MGDTVALAHGRIEVEERPGYLLMVEHGTLRTVDDVAQYAAAMELLVVRCGIRRAVIDSRQADAIEPPKDVRDAMWRWLLSARAFDQIAFVLGNEMHLARVNMTALSHRANIKAFTAVHEAHRWLTGRQRSLSQVLPAATGPLPSSRAEGAPRTPPPPRDPALRDSAVRDPALRDPAVRDPTPRDPAVRDPAMRNTGRWTPAPRTPVPPFDAPTPIPPPRRMSTPPPAPDRSSSATRRTSEIAIPVPRLPDFSTSDSRTSDSRTSDSRASDPGPSGPGTRRTGQLMAARRASEPRVPVTTDEAESDGGKSGER